ncbi:MAG: hypothetical protein M1415_11540 [Firmicutes bacterium]|jgi:hypothetical protein|nr:hypothetical protein [Bacillota bacterium]MCL5065674.1 hypothetical protein [Bacillota bacterium]
MLNKSLAFFDGGQTVELATPIFVVPQSKRRGRRPGSDSYFPNGERIPSRAELIAYIMTHVLYQIDDTLEGPIFCKHVIKCNQERNRDSMYHIVMGAHQWSGVWEVVGNRRMFDVRALYLPSDDVWVPQVVLSPGNYIGVDNCNGFELGSKELRREMIQRGLVTPEEYDQFANPSAVVRHRAISRATRGIWM